MRFKNTLDETNLEFTNPVNYIEDSDELAIQLLKSNYENEDSPWVFTLSDEEPVEEIKIFDVVQVKINVRDVGYFLAFFKKDSINKETKNELFNKLLALKEINVFESDEALTTKISSALKIVDEYHPYFVMFAVTYFYDKLDIIVPTFEGLSFPLFYTKTNPIEDGKIVVRSKFEKSKKKDRNNFYRFMINHFDNVQVENACRALCIPVPDKEELNKEEEENQKQSGSFNKVLVNLGGAFKNVIKYKIDHLFNALYSLLIAVCLLISEVYFDNKNAGIGILFLAFSVLFFALIVSNIYLLKKENKGKVTIYDFVVFGLISLVFIALGVVLGWALTDNLIKFENPIDFKKAILLSAIVSPILVILAHFVTLLVEKLFKKKKEA